MPAASEEEGDDSNRGFEGHWCRHVRLGLALTLAERLRWLEQTLEGLRPLVGRASRGRPVSPDGSANPMGAGSGGAEVC